MREFQGKVLIICDHPSSLIEYSKLLNQFGVFSLLLCSNVNEALLYLESGVSFSHLVYVGFTFDVDGCSILKKLCMSGREIILLSEATETQYATMHQWAASFHLSLHILPRPVSIRRLMQILSLH